MAYSVYFNGVAREHFLNAALWYVDKNEALVDLLEADVDRTVGYIVSQPNSYPVVYRDIHRAVLKRFPYNIYYKINKEEIEVIAFLHHRQNKEIILRDLGIPEE